MHSYNLADRLIRIGLTGKQATIWVDFMEHLFQAIARWATSQIHLGSAKEAHLSGALECSS